MAYKFSKGGRELGDIEFENDGDTKINFEEDYISLEAGGNPVLTVSGSRVGVLNNSPREALDINGTLLLSSSANQELIRISKANADIREITFENEGADIGSIYFNAAEHMFIRQEDASKDLSLRVGTTNAVRCDGSTSRVGIYTDTPQATLDVNGGATFASPISFPDILLAELSIPGVDLQTDTNAFRFNCPYDLDVTSLGLALDQHSTSGDVTVTVTNTSTGNTMITLSITGTNLGATTTTVANASAGQGDVITFAITATPANAQSLRASLGFRRDL